MSSRLRRNSGDIAFVLGLSAVGWSHWLDMHHLASAVAVAALALGWYSGRSKGRQ